MEKGSLSFKKIFMNFFYINIVCFDSIFFSKKEKGKGSELLFSNNKKKTK